MFQAGVLLQSVEDLKHYGIRATKVWVFLMMSSRLMEITQGIFSSNTDFTAHQLILEMTVAAFPVMLCFGYCCLLIHE